MTTDDVPSATYRLQFREGMTLSRAAELAPYWKRLGVSHLYASPIYTAAPGSTHGYDVIDFNAVDPAIGGMDGFLALSDALKAEGLGLVLDFVPNHMGVSTRNAWWRSVLEWGPQSLYEPHFDVDWNAGKLLLPVLGRPYEEALEDGELGLAYDPSEDGSEGALSLTYYEQTFPLLPTSYGQVLAACEDETLADLGRRFAATTRDGAEGLKQQLAGAPRAALKAGIEAAAADRDAMHRLHEAQLWRLAHWRMAREALTYRRFFEVTDLVGVRVERPQVFEDVHRLTLDLVREGRVQGLRLDHIDGLADPTAYLHRLREEVGPDLYILVEKILEPGEELRADWPIAGTTGYEFVSALSGLFVDPDNADPLEDAYDAFTGETHDVHALIDRVKRRILTRNLAAELDILADLALSVAGRQLSTRDLGRDTLRRSIIELAAHLPVYRTYSGVGGVEHEDGALLARVAEAAKATREVENEIGIDFVVRMLLLDFAEPDDAAAALTFTTRFQQTTGPVMAKALEDTVFYRYNRLIALNEVGGEPDQFGASAHAFHEAMGERLKTQPGGLSTTATHDTKRGEDARARLYAVSEMPEAWGAAAARWRDMNANRKTDAEGEALPDPEFEWLFYQALAGAWPADLAPDDADGVADLEERMSDYALKAAREAKDRTSWTAADEPYEAALTRFVEAVVSPENARFLADFAKSCAPLFAAGAVNALSQLAIKLTAPGVPDIYQGTEVWDFSLVDPDNRRPPDFARLAALEDDAETRSPAALLEDWRSGAPKAALTRAGLGLRARSPALFASGDYLPVEIEGPMRDHALAFARVGADAAVLTVAARRALRLLDGADAPVVPAGRWQGTRLRLPDALAGRYRDVLTGEERELSGEVEVGGVLAAFPAALLERR